jgi:hypothetical protein
MTKSALPEWAEKHWGCYKGEECPLRQALSIAWEALQAIEDGLIRIPMDSHKNCAASYRIAKKALRRIDELGK